MPIILITRPLDSLLNSSYWKDLNPTSSYEELSIDPLEELENSPSSGISEKPINL
jgi:hypothetical protein